MIETVKIPSHSKFTHEEIDEEVTRSRGSLNNYFRKSSSSTSPIKTKTAQHPLEGSTLIHLAAERGHDEILMLLFQENLKIDEKRGDNLTPVYLAAKEGYLKAVELLINKGANGDDTRAKNNCLIISHMNKHLDILAFLRTKYSKSEKFNEYLQKLKKRK